MQVISKKEAPANEGYIKSAAERLDCAACGNNLTSKQSYKLSCLFCHKKNNNLSKWRRMIMMRTNIWDEMMGDRIEATILVMCNLVRSITINLPE